MLRRTLLLLALFLAASAAYPKSLYWRSIEVDAQLDGSGLLHVVETQTFVFDGDWNGGERTFDIRAGQSLQLEGVDRIDDGQVIPLARGDLVAVDHYDLLDGTTLRWRSRLAEDPPFENRELTYRIRYTLKGILRGRDNLYRMAHDFAFPDRQGVIERFALCLTLDPRWSGIESPHNLEQHNLEPGRSVIVRGDLAYLGGAAPDAVIVPPSPWLGHGLLGLLAVGLGALLLRFLAKERKAGRIGNFTPLAEIDAAWLDRTVFSLPPEVVGAAWDGKVGAPEVAAVLAALVCEKQIETQVEPASFLRKPRLAMRLLVERDRIAGYRGSVIRKLFFGGRVNTDTDAVRKHYKNAGLDLAAVIRQPIERQLEALPGWTGKTRPVNWRYDALAVVVAFALLVAAGIWGGDNDGALAGSEAFVGLVVLAVGAVAAHLNARAIGNLALRFAGVIAVTLPLVIGTIHYLLEAPDYLFTTPALLAAVAWNLAVFNLILDALRIDERPEKIAARKKLASARAYFQQQLQSRSPALRDDWFPYLLAFGLGENVDSWFRAYGQARVGATRDHASSPDTSFPGGGGQSWTGGGGAFGGAGANGAWAVAATAVGAGVAAPGSSSGGGSSSSGGGGGSSSGGGGGGGW
jgi:uncharacterized membrane protein YgcG